MWDEEWQTDVDLTADERVKAVVLADIRDHSSSQHACDEMVVTQVLGSDGYYGCETGCLQPDLNVVVTCPHFPDGREVWVRGGLCDTLADFIDRMAQVTP